MIRTIKLCMKHSGRIDHGKKISFLPGYNVVIGPNGSGKSSLLKAIKKCGDCVAETTHEKVIHLFDSETMNPHRSEDSFTGSEGSLIKVRAMFSSHGETMRDVLRNIQFKKGDCFLLDEPESGHDLQWMLKIRKGLSQISRQGCQVIAASHHPVFWKNADVVALKKNYYSRLERQFNKICQS